MNSRTFKATVALVLVLSIGTVNGCTASPAALGQILQGLMSLAGGTTTPTTTTPTTTTPSTSTVTNPLTGLLQPAPTTAQQTTPTPINLSNLFGAS